MPLAASTTQSDKPMDFSTSACLTASVIHLAKSGSSNFSNQLSAHQESGSGYHVESRVATGELHPTLEYKSAETMTP